MAMTTMGRPAAPASIQFSNTRLFMSGTSSAAMEAAWQIIFFGKLRRVGEKLGRSCLTHPREEVEDSVKEREQGDAIVNQKNE